MMKMRFLVSGVVALAASAMPVRAQTPAKKQAEATSAAVKAMAMQKPKTKKSMLERGRMKPAQASSAARSQAPAGPTSVREVKPLSSQ